MQNFDQFSMWSRRALANVQLSVERTIFSSMETAFNMTEKFMRENLAVAAMVEVAQKKSDRSFFTNKSSSKKITGENEKKNSMNTNTQLLSERNKKFDELYGVIHESRKKRGIQLETW